MSQCLRRNRARWIVGGLACAAVSYASGPVLGQPPNRRRIGFLGATTVTGWASRWTSLRRGLAALGWFEGRNLEIVERYADDDIERLPRLAAAIVDAGIEVLVTHGIPGTRAARQATTTVPIVMATIADPVAAGLVASYARPGGNITGTTFRAQELAGKRIELLREAVPAARRVAVLSNARNPLFNQAMFEAMQAAAPQVGLVLDRFSADDPERYPEVMAELAARRPDALAVTEDAAFNARTAHLAALALQHRLPTVGVKEFCDGGGLIGYGADFSSMFERAAHFVNRLLRGARAADLPIEQPLRFELAANLQTARALDLALPKSLLVRADVLIR